MSARERVELGADGARFVRGRIGGWTGEGYALREGFAGRQLASGRFWTWSSTGIEVRMSDLEDGLWVGISQREMHDQAVQFISEYLALGSRLALLEDYEASPHDSWLAQRQPPVEQLVCQERLYWYATDPSMVRPMLLWGKGLFCCVALAPTTARLRPGSEVPVELIRGLAAMADYFIVDAFDFEGYMVWSGR